MSNYAQFDEIEEMNDGRCPWRSVAAQFGITSFGINTWTAPAAGDRIINEHDESDADEEELYIVLRGRATFELDGEQVDAPSGTLVFAQPGIKRTAFAAEPETTIVAVGAVAGKAYEPSGWPLWAPLHPLYEEGRYEEAADRGRELLEAHPHYGGVFYNVACCESLAGRSADALEHLRRSVELSDRFRVLAKDDTDFDSIRGEPAFKEIVGA
jgi:mannose-6-phosphate isomerase-like protein (cupin superfamily)